MTATTLAPTQPPAVVRATTGATGPTNKRSTLSTVVLLVGAAYCLLPVAWVLIASSKSASELFTTFTFTPSTHLWENIQELSAYRGGLFWRWMANTALYAVVGAFASVIVSAMAGFGLAKFNFVGKKAIFNIILAGVLVPGVVLAIPQYLLLAQVGLTNTYWSVLLPSIISPYGIYLARIYAAASVPDELLESARLDGAGEFRAFFTISSRLMAPALVTIFLFQFVTIWNNYLLPLVMLQNTKLYPVTLGLATWNSQKAIAGNLQLYVVVGALLSIIPLMIAFLALQRFWQSGLSEGGVKS